MEKDCAGRKLALLGDGVGDQAERGNFVGLGGEGGGYEGRDLVEGVGGGEDHVLLGVGGHGSEGGGE